jgi:hypothetical protein
VLKVGMNSYAQSTGFVHMHWKMIFAKWCCQHMMLQAISVQTRTEKDKSKGIVL